MSEHNHRHSVFKFRPINRGVKRLLRQLLDRLSFTMSQPCCVDSLSKMDITPDVSAQCPEMSKPCLVLFGVRFLSVLNIIKNSPLENMICVKVVPVSIAINSVSTGAL